MPSKKKYNARFPAGRIKKIMQTDDEVGKVAQAVPIIISRTLELFVESLIKKTMEITMMKNAKTLSPHHILNGHEFDSEKQCILSESRFDFLRDLVKGVPEGAASDDDVGSISDNSSSVQQIQRRDSKDVAMKENTEDPPRHPGLNFYRETQISASDPPNDSDASFMKSKIDSSDSDDYD